MSEAITMTSRGPNSYERLKVLRGTYALIVLGILLMTCCLSGVAQTLWSNTSVERQREDMGSADLLEPPRPQDVLSPWLWVTFSFLPALMWIVVTGVYAGKVGVPHPIIPAVLAPWPFVQWVAFFVVVGFTADHLKEFEPEENRELVPVWLALGLLICLFPIAVLALLGAVNPAYMGQLFYGPPVGAYVPGLPIPCGWPILGMICLGVLSPAASMWLGFYKGRVRGWWKLLLVVLVLLHFILPSLWLVLMGPAAVQVYKQFFGS